MYALAIRKRVAGIFAISRLALEQFQKAGIERRKLYPFGYFVPCRTAHRGFSDFAGSSTSALSGAGLRLICIGSLIQRKGIDLLIDAVRYLDPLGLEVTVDFYGPGDPEKYQFDGRRVRYCGSIPFGEAPKVISSYDALVLPSRYDGWGVVVNEALSAGVPVICSECAGAATLVRTFSTGYTFSPNVRDSLGRLLATLAEKPARLSLLRRNVLEAARAVEPRAAAKYMQRVLDSGQGAVPWSSPWYEDRV